MLNFINRVSLTGKLDGTSVWSWEGTMLKKKSSINPNILLFLIYPRIFESNSTVVAWLTIY